MLLEPLEFARHDRTGGHQLFPGRIDEGADNKKPREACGCLILLPLVRCGSDDQVADQLAGADDAVVLNPAAMGIAQEETAIRRDASLPPSERDKLTEEYATRAVELLTKARTTGFFKDRAKVEHLKEDTDLDPLRFRSDFRQLLADLEKPAP